MSPDSQSGKCTSGISRIEVTGVTWTDDDGTTYRRTFRDGEIVDIEVSR